MLKMQNHQMFFPPVSVNANQTHSLRRVLIVEDEVIVALEIQHYLEHLGYEVIDNVTTGEDAISKANELKPDLILMDIRLEEEMDGIEAACQIREQRDVPIVFLTAYGDNETLERAHKASPGGYLLKPFDSRSLHMTIEIAYNNYILEQHLRQSYDDLLHILNILEIGSVLTNRRGDVTFMSASACRLLGIERRLEKRTPWQDLFPFSDAVIQQIELMSQRDVADREKIPIRTELDDGTCYWMDLDIQNDPRDPDDRLFLLYDVTEVFNLRSILDDRSRFYDLVGKSAPMQNVFQQIDMVSRVDSTVIIEGETGTGKELVARAIHQASPRSNKPFIAVNCAALSDELAASQLFGHKKGAFTGAFADHKGYFEAAEGGTLFLDEIGDIPLDVQVNLLRVLEQRTISRVGESTTRNVNVRIVAATHRNLLELVQQGKFRADLMYRIRIARVDLPPLRKRKDDIPLLVRVFLQQCRAATGIPISEVSFPVMQRLLEYEWPGNVRELRNSIEYAVIRANGSILQVDDLPPEMRDMNTSSFDIEHRSLDEKGRMLAALEQANGNRKEAARILGMSRATFYRRLNAYKMV